MQIGSEQGKVMRGTHTKATMRFPFTPTRTVIIKQIITGHNYFTGTKFSSGVMKMFWHLINVLRTSESYTSKRLILCVNFNLRKKVYPRYLPKSNENMRPRKKPVYKCSQQGYS